MNSGPFSGVWVFFGGVLTCRWRLARTWGMWDSLLLCKRTRCALMNCDVQLWRFYINALRIVCGIYVVVLLNVCNLISLLTSPTLSWDPP